MIERYGVTHAMQSETFKIQRQKTCERVYGVKHPMMLSCTWKKAHETKKRNGTYGNSISKIEKQFGLVLHKLFDHVDEQVVINNWKIDFYINDINTYVQFDGVYWHGLDRPIEMILKHKTKRDISIHKNLLQDQLQIDWFQKHNMNFVRITDKMFQKFMKNNQQLGET